MLSMKRILGSLVSIVLAASLVEAQAPRGASTPREKLAREIYAELVGINTADMAGSPTRAARAMAKRFIDAGFPAEDVKILSLIHISEPTRPLWISYAVFC